MTWNYQPPIARDHALEARIAEDLDALEPYLVYADWLQERGDPRGELITIQVLMETADATSMATLRQREIDLLRDHLAYLRGPLSPTAITYHRRGFVRQIDVIGNANFKELLAALAIDHIATSLLACVRTDLDLDSVRGRITATHPACVVTAFGR